MRYLTYTKKVVLALALGANILGLATLAALNIVDSSRYNSATVILSSAPTPTVNPNCVISIESPELDPAYIQSTITNRKFTPQNMPVTVMDDLIVKYDNTNCHLPPSGPNQIANNYNEYYAKLSFVTTDSGGHEVLLASQTFGSNDSPTGILGTQTNGIGYWRFNLTALNSAVNSQPFLETLIDSIAKKRPIKVKIENDTTAMSLNGGLYLATFIATEKSVAMTNCYQAYGNGENKVIMMRALLPSSYTISLPQLSTDITNIKNDFISHSPLKQNIAKFSFFADLGQIDENTALAQGISPSTPKKDILGKMLGNIGKASSCGSSGTHILRSTLPGIIMVQTGQNFDGFTLPGSGIMIDSVSGTIGLVLHEFGHSFSALNDEYVHPVPAGVSPKSTNCSSSPSTNYKHNSQLYGATNLLGCTKASAFRPSDSSIMNNPQGPEFNTVSCGYILARINKSNDPKSFFPACNTMLGITHYP
jgi:hypothetical protein